MPKQSLIVAIQRFMLILSSAFGQCHCKRVPSQVSKNKQKIFILQSKRVPSNFNFFHEYDQSFIVPRHSCIIDDVITIMHNLTVINNETQIETDVHIFPQESETYCNSLCSNTIWSSLPVTLLKVIDII